MSSDENVSNEYEAEPVFIRPRRLRPANWNELTFAERGLHDPKAPIPFRKKNPGDVSVSLPVAEAKLII